MEFTPRIGVVVCSRNRASRLAVCLEHLSRLNEDPRDVEIIVVDNGSTDKTKDTAWKEKDRSPIPIYPISHQKPGLGGARNAGVARSKAPLIAFTDDDCYVDPDWTRNLRRLFDENPDVGLIGGRIKLFDPTDVPVTIRDDDAEQLYPRGTFMLGGWLNGANMAVRRSAFNQVGGFDEQFGAGAKWCGEDVDFQTRVSGARWQCLYHPDPLVYHHHGRKQADKANLARFYARGRGAAYLKALLTAPGAPQLETYAKNWYWWLRGLVAARKWRELWHEMAGAGHFLAANPGLAWNKKYPNQKLRGLPVR